MAARCVLEARGVTQPTKYARAGALLEAEYQLSVLAFLKGLSNGS
jgi:hypothetical protein